MQNQLRRLLETCPFMGNRKAGYQAGVRCVMSGLHGIRYDLSSDNLKSLMQRMMVKTKKNPRRPIDEGFNEGLKKAMEEIKKMEEKHV